MTHLRLCSLGVTGLVPCTGSLSQSPHTAPQSYSSIAPHFLGPTSQPGPFSQTGVSPHPLLPNLTFWAWPPHLHPFQDSDSDTEGGAAGGEAESEYLPWEAASGGGLFRAGVWVVPLTSIKGDIQGM